MGFMGQNRGSFFGTPEWVELEKKPGHTSIGKVYPDGSTFKSSLNWFLGWANPWNFFVMSPNFVWFLVAFTDYALCPYDLDKARVFTADWVLYRCAINTFIMLTYFGFWSLTLYSLGFGTRKFNPDHVTGAGRMFHNLWYCILGSVQLGLWEALLMHCYATGKLEYISNEEAFATPGNIARVVFWTLAVPLYRCEQPHHFHSQRCTALDAVALPQLFTSISRIDSFTSAPCTSTCTRCTTATRTSSLSAGCACTRSNTCTTTLA